MSRDQPGSGNVELSVRDTEGRMSRRRFFRVLAFSSTALILILIAVLTMGMFGSVLGAGLGGFVMSFGHVDATGDPMNLDPVLGDQQECPDAPQMQATMSGTATVSEGLTIYKDLPLPSTDYTADTLVRVDVSTGGGELNVSELGMRMTAFNSQVLELQSTSIGERNMTEQDGAEDSWVAPITGVQDGASVREDAGEFKITADDGAVITNGTAVTYMVAFSSIDVPALSPGVALVNTSKFEELPVVNPLNVDQMTCRAISNRSGPGIYEAYPDSIGASTPGGDATGPQIGIVGSAVQAPDSRVVVEGHNAPVAPEDTLAVTVAVESSEGEGFDGTVFMRVDGERMDSEELSVSPDGRATTTLSWETDDAESGLYDVVAGLDD